MEYVPVQLRHMVNINHQTEKKYDLKHLYIQYIYIYIYLITHLINKFFLLDLDILIEYKYLLRLLFYKAVLRQLLILSMLFSARSP